MKVTKFPDREYEIHNNFIIIIITTLNYKLFMIKIKFTMSIPNGFRVL